MLFRSGVGIATVSTSAGAVLLIPTTSGVEDSTSCSSSLFFLGLAIIVSLDKRI